MKSLHTRYPRNWFEANRLIKNLTVELIKAQEFPRGHKRSKEILKIIKVSYTILDSLDKAIATSKDHKEIKRLTFARSVLSSWIKKRNFPENLK